MNWNDYLNIKNQVASRQSLHSPNFKDSDEDTLEYDEEPHFYSQHLEDDYSSMDEREEIDYPEEPFSPLPFQHQQPLPPTFVNFKMSTMERVKPLPFCIPVSENWIQEQEWIQYRHASCSCCKKTNCMGLWDKDLNHPIHLSKLLSIHLKWWNNDLQIGLPCKKHWICLGCIRVEIKGKLCISCHECIIKNSKNEIYTLHEFFNLIPTLSELEKKKHDWNFVFHQK